ncbi:hypothetical protein QTG54_015636 [Skeletonema marinoi]|uniref:MYND-type domain-containing protein n=1 Tax=Skeletonema marinoi TaxID=267567 RepID=A0AAD9D4J9_9STRA|nr:hypothetical protein QTG54_015636 [Skeletonema marinoi]
MSGANNLESAVADMMCCAYCGIAEGDDIKLKTCNACKSARYCSITCQKQHRPQHKQECKKRAAELRDELLFKQPESNHYGDCPICCLPLLLDEHKSLMSPCCSKRICNGCVHANQMREAAESSEPKYKCPFCRHPAPKTQEQAKMIMMKRVAASDPVAMCQMGSVRFNEGDYNTAFEYWTKATGLGDVGSHYNLSLLYMNGLGVEKDKKKRLHHLEAAAIGGDHVARNHLAIAEWENGRQERAIKHWIIAATLGDDNAVKCLRERYVVGDVVCKEDFAAALRAHQAAIDATKSPQREAAAKAVATGGLFMM